MVRFNRLTGKWVARTIGTNHQCAVKPMKTHPNKPTRSHPGFTLVELLVTITIIAVLAAISGMAVVKMKRSAIAGKAATQLRTLGAAMLGYAGDHDSRFPDMGHYPGQTAPDGTVYTDDLSWDGQLEEYLGLFGVIRKSTPPVVPKEHETIFFHGNDRPPAGGLVKNPPYALRTFAMFSSWAAGLPVVKAADPSRTGLLSERPWAGYRAAFKSAADLGNINQWRKNPDTNEDLNPGGKFHVLFVDGHLETLAPRETIGTGSLSAPKGLWTLDAKD
jgi:prepilin-type N-terminal cleavage/methylation domain-containing protein/prepilin-type processing-associated H-X9-DG protein